MKKNDKNFRFLMLIFIMWVLFLLNCGGIGPVAEGDILVEKSITKNGITFYEYIDSLHMRWGFDSASNAISVPAVLTYRCGLRVNRDEKQENYDSVKILASPSAVISYIDPQFLLKGMNTLTILLISSLFRCKKPICSVLFS